MVTWVAILIVIALPVFKKQPFAGRTVELQNLTLQDDEYRTEFNSAQIENSRPWHPSSPNPPLSAGKALNIAETFRQEHLNDLDNNPFFDTRWLLKEISLQALDSKSNKWCWIVTFQQSKPADKFMALTAYRKIYIDMNGKIFPSTKKKTGPVTSFVAPTPQSGSGTSSKSRHHQVVNQHLHLCFHQAALKNQKLLVNESRRITMVDPKRRSPCDWLVAEYVILRVYYFTSLRLSSANWVRRSDNTDVIRLQMNNEILSTEPVSPYRDCRNIVGRYRPVWY